MWIHFSPKPKSPQMINLRHIYEESWAFYRKNWVQITAALILLFLLETLLDALIPISGLQFSEEVAPEQLWSWLFSAIPLLLLRIAYVVFIGEIFFALHQLAILIFIQHWQRGEKVDFLTAIKECRPYLLNAVKVPGLVLRRIFLPLLALVPGVYLAFLYTFSFHATIVESYPPKDALERSRRLVRAHWKPTLALIVLNALLTFAGNLLFSPLNALGGDPESGFSFPLGQTVSSLTFGAITQISMMFFYFHLRLLDEETSTDSTPSSF